MGFPLKMPKWFNLLYCFKFMSMPILKVLGLVKPLEIEPDDYDHHQDSDVLVVDGLSIISVPVEALTWLIKDRLRIVLFRDTTVGSSVVECSVCLEGVERNDAVRELVNCSHVFHQACLDRWVDECRVTCPLCRSMLFPPNHIHHLRSPIQS